MKIHFIVNPISGTGNYKNLEKVLESELDTVLFQYDISYTKAPKHATQLAQDSWEEVFLSCPGSPDTSKRPVSPKGDFDLPWVGARAGHL